MNHSQKQMPQQSWKKRPRGKERALAMLVGEKVLDDEKGLPIMLLSLLQIRMQGRVVRLEDAHRQNRESQIHPHPVPYHRLHLRKGKKRLLAGWVMGMAMKNNLLLLLPIQIRMQRRVVRKEVQVGSDLLRQMDLFEMGLVPKQKDWVLVAKAKC